MKIKLPVNTILGIGVEVLYALAIIIAAYLISALAIFIQK